MLDKYFIDKNGAKTRRVANKAGSGHFEVMREVLGDLIPVHELYDAMFRHGFIRVVETDTEIMVDAPKEMTRRQRDAVRDASITPPGMPDKKIIVNDRHIRESRDPRGIAQQIIGQ